MANILYFADTNGQTVSFKTVDYRPEGTFGFDVETNSWLKVSRKVIRKVAPSNHVCDDRCIHATGKTLQCECSCGGKNHGRGY